MVRTKPWPKPQFAESDISAVTDVLKSGLLSGFRGNKEGNLGGPKVQELEERFCGYLGVKYAVAMQSATAALHTACIICDVRGGEAIVSPYSFSSSASCALMAGGKPVFCDIQDDIFCIDPLWISGLRTSKTKAIIPVHLMGHPADMDKIMQVAIRYGLCVIEDAAQALGAEYHGKKVGTIGDMGIFSFNQSKQICTGEGGMLVTNNDEIAEKARLIRNHGETQSSTPGYNFRLGEMEAALAIEQLKRYDVNLGKRYDLTSYLTEKLRGIEGITPPIVYDNCEHAWYTYAIKVNREDMTRDQFQERVLAEGIYFGEGYVTPLYHQDIYAQMDVSKSCPVAERMYETICVTDIVRPPATFEDIMDIVSAVRKVCGYS